MVLMAFTGRGAALVGGSVFSAYMSQWDSLTARNSDDGSEGGILFYKKSCTTYWYTTAMVLMAFTGHGAALVGGSVFSVYISQCDYLPACNSGDGSESGIFFT